MDSNTQLLTVLTGTVWVRLAGVFGAVAVALAAVGAHLIHNNKNYSEHLQNVYERANKLHLIHSLVLMAVPLTAHPCITGPLILIGMTLFSGTCYINVFTGNKEITRFTPVGGITLMIGWLTMAYV